MYTAKTELLTKPMNIYNYSYTFILNQHNRYNTALLHGRNYLLNKKKTLASKVNNVAINTLHLGKKQASLSERKSTIVSRYFKWIFES